MNQLQFIGPGGQLTMVHFGERLKHAMASRVKPGPVTVPELARACEVSYQAVKKWQDRPPVIQNIPHSPPRAGFFSPTH